MSSVWWPTQALISRCSPHGRNVGWQHRGRQRRPGGRHRPGSVHARRGKLADLLAGVAIDWAVGMVIEKLLDPTEEIVAGLRQPLELAETQAQNGPQGLLTLMQRMNETHQAARGQWLLPETE